MFLLAEYTFGQGLLTVLSIFIFVAWIMVLITILSDLFRDHDTSGWVKAIWVLFLIFIPFLTALVYLIARGSGMRERSIKAQEEQQKQFDAYVRQAGGTSAADEVAKLKKLHDDGAITRRRVRGAEEEGPGLGAPGACGRASARMRARGSPPHSRDDRPRHRRRRRRRVALARPRRGLARASLTASVFTLLPFVTFFNVARLEIDADIGFGILLGYVAIAIAAGLAWWAGRAMDLSRPTRGTLITCALVANTGYLGYPLTASLLGFDALGEAVVWDLLVGAPALLLVGFAVGAAFGEKAGETPRERVRAFFTRNPPLYAAIAALLAPDALAPDALVDASRVAVIALLPIGFFAVGATLAEEAEEGYLRLGSPFRPPVSVAIALRMIVAPGLLLADGRCR